MCVVFRLFRRGVAEGSFFFSIDWFVFLFVSLENESRVGVREVIGFRFRLVLSGRR